MSTLDTDAVGSFNFNGVMEDQIRSGQGYRNALYELQRILKQVSVMHPDDRLEVEEVYLQFTGHQPVVWSVDLDEDISNGCTLAGHSIYLKDGAFHVPPSSPAETEELMVSMLASISHAMNREYYSGYGSQNLYGHIVFRKVSGLLHSVKGETVWIERRDYDGSEYWHVARPPRATKDRVDSIRGCSSVEVGVDLGL